VGCSLPVGTDSRLFPPSQSNECLGGTGLWLPFTAWEGNFTSSNGGWLDVQYLKRRLVPFPRGLKTTLTPRKVNSESNSARNNNVFGSSLYCVSSWRLSSWAKTWERGVKLGSELDWLSLRLSFTRFTLFEGEDWIYNNRYKGFTITDTRASCLQESLSYCSSTTTLPLCPQSNSHGWSPQEKVGLFTSCSVIVVGKKLSEKYNVTNRTRETVDHAPTSDRTCRSQKRQRKN